MPADKGIFNKILARLIKISIVFLILAVFNSFLQVFVIFQSQRIIQLQSKIELLENDISRIQVEMASLESFDRIQTIATNELGMRTPNPDDYHWIEALPVASVAPVHNNDLREATKAELWGLFYQWAGNIGKTMANSL